MRLFAAVTLDEAVRAAAHKAGARLARALSGAGMRSRTGISWVRLENLHLTMRFLGEVEERRAGELVKRFAAPLAATAFEIDLGGFGVFPPSGPPRVVWVGVTRGADRLVDLSGEIEGRFIDWGFGRADKPFRAHLTLGRCRDPLGHAARERLTITDAGVIGTSRVADVVLYESRLSSAGPTDVALARAPLAEREAAET